MILLLYIYILRIYIYNNNNINIYVIINILHKKSIMPMRVVYNSNVNNKLYSNSLWVWLIQVLVYAPY